MLHSTFTQCCQELSRSVVNNVLHFYAQPAKKKHLSVLRAWWFDQLKKKRYFVTFLLWDNGKFICQMFFKKKTFLFWNLTLKGHILSSGRLLEYCYFQCINHFLYLILWLLLVVFLSLNGFIGRFLICLVSLAVFTCASVWSDVSSKSVLLKYLEVKPELFSCHFLNQMSLSFL